MDVTANLTALAAADSAFIHLKGFDLPPQEEKLVITTAGIVQLGNLRAQSCLEPVGICNDGRPGLVGMKSILIFHLISPAPSQ